MNKIFKVVWSKTKECYVVVSEVAKNNGGKKKALSTVFAALVAVGAMIPGQAGAISFNGGNSGGHADGDASIAIGSGWGDSAYANTKFSIAIGDQANATGEAAIALGRKAKTNGEQASIAIGNQTEAIAKDSTAVGSGSKSSGEYAAALGFQTKATANYATAIGSGARGYAEDSQAIGREAETSAGALRAIAIGTLSKSSANYATSLGSSAEATAERAIAVGYKSKAEAERAISVGNLANASKNDSIAVGNNSAASGLNASAVGKNSKASGQSAAAFGDTAQATNTNATAVGNQANASNTNTTAIGNETVASGGNATAIGHKSQATGDGAVAVGTNNKADYEGAAVGLSNTVTGRTSAAFGRSNTVTGKESFAAGVRSTASGEHNVAIGYQAVTDNKATVAIGEGSKADIADGVALGSNSATTAAAGVQGFDPAYSRANRYGGLSGTAQTSTLGAVAVGNGPTATRQITGLAAGKEDTDAVNVAQLRSVNLKYAGNSGNSDVLLDDGTLNIKGEGLLSTTANGTGITVKLTKGDDIANDNGKAKEPTNNGVATTQNVVQAINNSYWKATAGGNTDGTPSVGNVKPGTQVTYSAGDNLKLKQTIAANGDQEYKYSLNADLKGINSISNSTTGPTMTFGGNSINITGGTLNMGNNKITNVAPGTDDKDAVNYSQIKGLRTEVKAGTGITVTPSKGTDGHDIYTVSSTATGGAASTESVVKKAAATGDTNIADVSVAGGKAVNDPGAQYEVSVSKNAVKDAAREAVTVNNGGNTDNPITVTPTQDNTNHNTTYAVTFDGNKAAKQIPLTYKATNGTTTTADQTVKLDKGLNFTGGDYTTASVGADGKVTFDVNLGTAPTVTDGKPGVPGQAGAAGKDGIATVKTVVDTINNSGWKANAKANGGTLDGSSTATVVKPGDQVNFAAGKNLTVKQDLTGEHTYTYSLNKDLKDLTSVEIGGSTIKTDGDHITITSPDTNPGATPGATVTNKVANLGDEKHIKPDTYAVANDGSVTLKYVDGNGKDLTETTKITGIAKKAKVINGKNTTVEEGTDTTDNSVTYKVNVKGDLADISSITNGTGSGKISFEGDQVVKVGGDHPISFDGKGGYVTGLQNKDWDITNPTVVSGRAATEDQLKKVSDGFNNTVKLTGNSGATGTQKLNQNGGLSFGVVGADNGKYITTTASGSNVVADLSTDAKAKLNSKVVVAGSGAATVAAPTVTTNPDGSTVTTYTVHVDPATATAASTESVVKKAVTGDTNIADVSVADGKATGDVGAKYEVSVSRNAVKDAAREAVTVNNGGTTTGGTYTADTNNPITVNPVKDDTNHNTTYEVKFDGNKAAKQIPLTYKANGNGAKTVTLDKGLDFTNGTNTTAVIGNDGVVKYNLNKDVDLSNTGSLTVGDTKVTNGGVTITAPAGGTTSNVTLTQSGLDNGGNKIINVAPGTLSSTSTDAVNGSQLYTVDQKFNNKINLGADGSTETTKFALDNTGGIKFNIKGDGSGASGANQYISTTANGSNVNVDLTADAKAKLNKTYTVSSGSTNVTVTPTTTGDNTDFKITVASTGTTTSSSWNLATDKVSATEGTVAAGSAATQNIADTKTVTMQAGKNLTVKQTNDGTGNASVAYSLDKDISVETVTVTGQNGKDGKIGIDGKDGVDGKDGKNRVEITVEKGAKGVDGTDGHDGVNGHNGKDGMTRIVYEDKGGKQEVATLNDGMKYAGDDAQGTDKTKVIAKKLNETLDIIGGANKTDLTTDNIGVNNDGNGKLLVQLSKNLKGINTIKNGNTTITLNDAPSTTTPAVTITGGNLSLGDGTTNNKIVNVAPGTDDTDAVNVKQLKDAKTVLADGKNTKKSGTGTAADPYKVNVEGDLTEITSITNKADASGNNAGKITFSPNQTVTVSGDHNISLNGKTGDITGLTNTTIPTTAGSDFATKGRAATEEQLKIVNDKFNNKINLGADTNETTKFQLDNASGIKFNIKGDGSGASGANQYISTTANGSNVNVDLTADAKAKLNKTYTVSSGSTNVTVTPTTTGDNTDFKITVASTGTTTSSSWNLATDKVSATEGTVAAGSAATQNIADTKTVTMQAGKNLTVKQTNDGTGNASVAYSLDKDISVETVTVTGQNGKDGKIGIDGKDGVDGKDGKNRVEITVEKGAKGVDGTDGHDGVNGHNGKDGMTRIVYEDKGGKQEVATLNDGMKYAGDDAQGTDKTKVIAKKLNETLDIIGGANKTDLTTDNIGVNNDGNGKLLVQLSKNLKGINTIKNGNTTITLNDAPSTTTPAVTITGGNLSLGDGTTNNKIVNVAPGTDDTDAVNVKQLKDAKTVLADGKNTKKSGTGTAADPYKVNVEGDLTEITSITNKADASGNNAGKITFSPNQTVTVSGDHNISLNGKTGDITGLTNTTIPTTAGSDFATKGRAATEEQLKSVHDTLKANERHIAPTTVAAGSTETKGGTANAGGTANVYKYDAASKTVTLTYNDGNGNAVTDTKAVIDLSNLSTGGTGASSWNIASDKVSATEGAVATGSAGTQNIADGKTVTMKAGKNLTVNQSNDGAGNASVAFSLDKNLENLDKVVVNGNDGATGQAGVSIVGPKGANGVDGNDGKVGIAGKDGKDAVSISGKDGVGHIGLQGPKGTPGTPGAPATPGANLDITTDHGTQTLVKPEANNNNKSERIVYVPKDASGNPLKDTDGNDIKREVATMDDGLKFTGNNESTENKQKLGSLVKVQGEGTKESTAVDPATGKKYVVLSDGTTKFESAKDNIAVEADGTDTLTVKLNKNLKGLNSIQLGGNTIQSNGDNITFTTNGGTTKTVATTDQLWTIQANGTDVPAKAGKVNLVAGDHITITPDAANGKMTISATGFGSMDGFNVKTSAESATVGTHAGDTTENIKNGKTVDMQAGKNLVVTQTNDGNGNTTVNYALNKDVDLGTNGSLKAGDTTVNKDGVTIANGPSITKTGVDAGDKKITNVADGDVNATSKDAVNGSQLKKYTDAAKTTVEAGDNNVKVDTDTTAADGHTNYKVSLKPVVTIGDTHKVKIDGQTGDITGLTNVDLTDPTFATKGRAATEEQLNKVLTEAKKKAVEKVQAGTAAAGDTNIATVAPKAGDTFGAAGATYEVSVSKNAVKDAAKEAVKVTSASPAITVTADTSVAHETTYKVGFDGNQAATQIPLTYKQNGGNTRTVKLSDGLNFIDGTNTKARTAADGKVTFDVMGDLTGITSISNAAGGPKMTFGGNSINVTNGDLNMGGNKITNLGKGTATTDAATVGQLTKVTSNNHSVVINKTTDANGAPVYDLAVSGTPGAPAADPRVDMLGEEIGRVGAQGAALSALKPIQYDPLEPTQIMAGYGNYRGNSAVALGVAHYKNESTLIHGGVSWAGGSSHMMANAGVTWKVGNRDSEAAVADRYRKGPISSAYAMQQEMAAMKAQNAGLKGEVSDLKAENEQMKAQIAAMMAKLGL